MKIKESENIHKYLDLARELKRFGRMKETVIPIADRALRTIFKNFEKRLELEIRGGMEAIQTKALLKSYRILRRVLEKLGNLQSFELQRKITSL